MSNKEIEFTEKNYKKILKKINNESIFYNEINKKNKFTLWRHDVDFSPFRAHRLAIIENKFKIKSTFFIQLGSNFYNIFEKDIKEIFLNIISLGHDIGLHFYASQYNIDSKKKLEKYLLFEKQILEKLLSTKIKVFSFHNPSKKILKYNNFKYANMINVYSKFLKENIHYCSDSNGYWRFQKLENFLDKNYKKIQVTTHPGWWTLKFMKPRQKIKRCIDGRAINCLKSYDKILFDTGRKNIR